MWKERIILKNENRFFFLEGLQKTLFLFKNLEFKDIEPELIFSKPAIHFKNVVLPDPLSPRKEIHHPS